MLDQKIKLIKNRVMRFEEVAQCTGLSRTTIWRLERAGKFPARFKISNKAVGWSAQEVENWLEQKRRDLR